MIYDIEVYEDEFLTDEELAELADEELTLEELGDEELIAEFNKLDFDLFDEDWRKDFYIGNRLTLPIMKLSWNIFRVETIVAHFSTYKNYSSFLVIEIL